MIRIDTSLLCRLYTLLYISLRSDIQKDKRPTETGGSSLNLLLELVTMNL